MTLAGNSVLVSEVTIARQTSDRDQRHPGATSTVWNTACFLTRIALMCF